MYRLIHFIVIDASVRLGFDERHLGAEIPQGMTSTTALPVIK